MGKELELREDELAHQRLQVFSWSGQVEWLIEWEQTVEGFGGERYRL